MGDFVAEVAALWADASQGLNSGEFSYNRAAISLLTALELPLRPADRVAILSSFISYPVLRVGAPAGAIGATMRFLLLDKITHLEPGRTITAQKLLIGDERFLIDHFPNFPCMPGVLMLEAMYQAGAWLLRETDHFGRPIVMLKEVRNVKYGSFVEPGQTLTVTVNYDKPIDDHTHRLKGQGWVEGKSAVSGVMICDQFRLSERYGTPESMDRVSRREYRSVYAKLQPPVAVESA